jgi:hypothetical protein
MFPSVFAVLGTALLSVGVAEAAEKDDKKPKRFSISFSGGIRPDMAQLGSTIAQDGSIDVAETSFANLAYSTNKALMSDRDNMTLAQNSKQTDSVFNVLDSYKEGGSLLGAEFGGDLRYEFDDLIDWPLFLKTGFYYTTRVSGGEQSRTFGDLAEQSQTVRDLAAINGLDPEDYSGGTMKTNWNARWWEIPISIGAKVHIKPHTFAYGYAGISIFKGGFDVGIDVDDTYSRILGTHVDTSQAIPPATDLSPGAVKDTIQFRTTALGLNYGLGAQIGIGRTWAVFLELNASGAAKTVYAQKYSEGSKKLLTTVSSQSLAESDETWFQTLAYPVVMQGASGRLGVRAYLF